MSGLSEVSRLFAQRAGDLEKAREVFSAETRNYVASILGAIQRTREPWTAVQRALAAELQPETLFNDVKAILDLLLSADVALAEAVGVELGPGEDDE